MVKHQNKENVNRLRVLKALVPGGVCVTRFGFRLTNSIANKAREFIYPALPQVQAIAFGKLQVNQHLALNVQRGKN